jgi:hypothetical protein
MSKAQSSLFTLKLFSIRLSLLFLCFLALSCNRVKESPEPDFFLQKELEVIKLAVTGDSVEINVMAANGINHLVTVEFSKPAHGTIWPRKDGRSFIYKAEPGFSGKDTIQYKLCRPDVCKESRVIIDIRIDQNFCSPVYSPIDTQNVVLSSGPKNIALPFLFGDVYCPDDVRQLAVVPSGLSNVSLSDSIRLRIAFSRNQRRNLLLAYTNKDSKSQSKIRYIKLSLLPDSNYCDDFFNVENREDPVHLNEDDTLRVNYSTFKSSVNSCEGDLDPDYFVLSSTPNLKIIPFGNGYKIISKRNSSIGPGYLSYRYRNIRGISDSGYLRIYVHL